MTKGKQTLLRLFFNSKEHTFDKKILSKYDWVDCFVCEDRAKVRLNEKEGYIDTDGNEICPIKYDETDIFSEGLASVRIDDKWGFINAEGEEVIPLMYDEVIRLFHKGIAIVRLGEKKLAINELGYIVKKL